jgi:shikimate kinase
MGSGKTAVGRRLAQELELDFIDTDDLAEARMGMSISDAFARQGEGFFRTREEEVICEELSKGDGNNRGKVISLGGGAVTTAGVRKLLEQEENVILLDVDKDTAYERSRRDNRPLAQDRDQFDKLYTARKELYRQVADIVIDVGTKNVDEVSMQITDLLEGRA